jgi:hypothetical protein
MQDLLPKIEMLPGAVHLQNVRCGKPNCRCATGKPHEAYYRFWRSRGKLRKAYVRKADLERVRAGCALWAEMDRVKIEMLNSAGGDKIRREIRAMLRSAGATEQIISKVMRKTTSNKSQP